MATDFIKRNNNNINALEGQLTLFTGVSLFNDASGLTYTDKEYTIDVTMAMQQTIGLLLLDTTGMDEGKMFVEQESRPLIYFDPAAKAKVDDTFTLLKSEYQPYWGVQYFSASILEQYVDNYSILVPPLYIDTVKADEANDTLEITTIPYEATLRMFNQGKDNEGYLVWSANGFATLTQNGERAQIDIDADPWMDQTFVAGDELYLSDAYGCNCPSFAHGMVTAPQSEYGPLNEDRRKANRQARYPLPSAGSYKDPEGLSDNPTAGTIVSWKTKQDQLQVPACKHVIASMFDDGLDVKEPRKVPAYTDQIKFAEELKNEPGIADTIDDAAERAEISFIDLLYSIAQVVMLTDTEIGSIVGGQTLVVDELEET